MHHSANAAVHVLGADNINNSNMVDILRLELRTSRLSSERSDLLSYTSITYLLLGSY